MTNNVWFDLIWYIYLKPVFTYLHLKFPKIVSQKRWSTNKKRLMKLQCTNTKLRSDYWKSGPQNTSLPTQFLSHKKFSAYEKFVQTFNWKNLHICYIRCYKCTEIFLHKLHLHEMSSHVFINRLKAERFPAFLICGSSLFRIFGPSTLKHFLPNFCWLALTIFKCRFCWLRQVYQMI